MQTTINERVAEFYKWTFLNTSTLARKLGLPQKTVYNYVNGKVTPSRVFLEAVEKAFPEVNIEYITKGEGMLLKDQDPNPPMPDSSKISLYEQLVESLKGQVTLLTNKCADLEEQVKTLRKLKEEEDNNKA